MPINHHHLPPPLPQQQQHIIEVDSRQQSLREGMHGSETVTI